MADIGDAVKRQAEMRDNVVAEAERLRQVRETEATEAPASSAPNTPPVDDEDEG